MFSFDTLDVTLYSLIAIDLVIKLIRYKSEMKGFGKTKRYHPSYTKTKKIIYIALIIICIGYLIYRLIDIKNGNNSFAMPSIVLPIILYYIIYDFLLKGIYYSKEGIYVKNVAIRFGEVTKSFRYFNEKDQGYDYTIYYRPRLSGEVEMNFFVKNEPAAFELMMVIPFDNEE